MLDSVCGLSFFIYDVSGYVPIKPSYHQHTDYIIYNCLIKYILLTKITVLNSMCVLFIYKVNGYVSFKPNFAICFKMYFNNDAGTLCVVPHNISRKINEKSKANVALASNSKISTTRNLCFDKALFILSPSASKNSSKTTSFNIRKENIFYK